jgi:site-specific DNA recombinase
MIAVAYARYSSDQQRASSIEDQVRNCRKRAAAEGWEISAVFSDAAMVGSDSSRPEYQRMLAAAARREFDVIVMDELSRFARDQVEQERAIRRLEFDGVRIITCTDGYDSTSKARKVLRTINGLKNEMEIDALRERVHRGLTGQALKGYWCGGRVYGYKLRPVLDPAKRDPYGQPERIGTKLEIDPKQGPIVQWMFERYADGASYLTLSRELNERGVPSPGSAWRRNTRRCRGWMQSTVRGILRNALYTGRQRWNSSQYLKHPDTGKDRKRARPKSEWLVHQDERLRIVSEELFERVRNRTRITANSDKRLKSGGKLKYLLSGLLRCEACGAHYIMSDARCYACSGYINGRACSNAVRIRRDILEDKILGPIQDDLLTPERVARMAKEMEQLYAEHLKQTAARAAKLPRELEELGARIERLRDRLKQGDPDLTADELQVALERAEEKRRQLEAQQPGAKQTAKLLSVLPRAAEIYRRQIVQGLEGDEREALKARAFLRGLFVDGKVVMSPREDGSLWAKYSMAPAVLLKGAGTGYRGDRI